MKAINLSSTAAKEAVSALLFVSAVIFLTFFRNPRIFMYPEPWQEDMAVFLSQEYNTGFPETAFALYQGYIHLLPRILAWAAMKFGLTDAMRAMTWMVFLINIYAFWLICTCEEIRSRLMKFMLLAYMVLMPFPEEVFYNATDLQWNLIPLMAVILIRKNRSVPSLVLDLCIIVLTGLTGINSVLFAIPCAYLFLRQRTINSFLKCTVNGICSLIQFYFIYSSPRVGKIMYNGGGLEVLNVYTDRAIWRTLFDVTPSSGVNIVVFTAYLLLLAVSLWHYRKNIYIHFILMFSVLLTAASFYNLFCALPGIGFLINGESRFWAERYFAFLRICTFMLLISSLSILFRNFFSKRNYRRLMAFSCFILCLIVLRNYPVRYQFEYTYYGEVARFESAKPGENVALHYPHGWWTVLVKK